MMNDLPLPPPLKGADKGTFTEYSLKTRYANIIARTLEEIPFPEAISADLQSLSAEIQRDVIRRLTDRVAPDSEEWDQWMQPYLGKSWFDVPWLVAEPYFFRRMLEATRYFEPGPTRRLDPFGVTKESAWRAAPMQIERSCQEVLDASTSQKDTGEELSSLFQAALLSNQNDLSMFAASNDSDESGSNIHILVDDSRAAATRLLSRVTGRVDYVLDNTGIELVSDLALFYFLLTKGLAQKIYVHVKPHPTYVSDVTGVDFYAALDHLENLGTPAAAEVSTALQDFIRSGRLELATNFFWISPLPAWEMPADLRAELSKSSLVILKGDLNYRRLLGDLHWPYTTPFDSIVSYYPAPLLALRSLKSNVAAGLAVGQPESLDERDPDWMIDGEWGLIQGWKLDATT